jgi:hypothetical protein
MTGTYIQNRNGPVSFVNLSYRYFLNLLLKPEAAKKRYRYHVFHFAPSFYKGLFLAVFRIRTQMVTWIRIRLPNVDPDLDSGGLKRAKMKKKKKTQLKVISGTGTG